MENTIKKGKYRWIIFKKGQDWYGAALEFNIVQVGDDPNLVYLEMQEAVKGYIEAAQKIKGFRDQAISPMLNQKSEEEYERLWDSAQKTKTPLPKNVFDFGTRNLAAV
ncbi:MAG: hypothetical protein COU10_04015 [Candidatus Harrisonbacteria bacterium CG10_big_fil_rev_8_21_14_0_10_45_28]|uniref:HicB family protein n=1 Tax=Candidatus Harrisonbacteria bacterium CG10_big_fil_rev_8_21_14_0_10_45_28 TaxID=1974586 RepID=A0A2H0UP40_9BACT|nr:MAG: hypothetical protein COU10_04015 [Candidatus Harrisonbacteria bacterium CG10_big_fil_rev_8_21_14_0_10_45_28]